MNKICKKHPFFVRYINLIFMGVFLDFVGVMANILLPFELSLDSIGSTTVALIGGFFPGAMTVFITSLIKEIFWPNEMYYALINMIMILLIAKISKKVDVNKNKAKLVFFVPFIMTVVGGILHTRMDWTLANESISTNVYIFWINEHFFIYGFLGMFLGNAIREFIDKFIVITISYFLFHLCPKETHMYFRHPRIWQDPLPLDVEEAVNDKNFRVISIKTKLFFMIQIVTVIIAVFSLVITLSMYRKSTINEHIVTAQNAAKIAQSTFDADKVDEYMKMKPFDKEYIALKKPLYSIRDNSQDLEFLYVYKIMEDGCHVVFDLDTEDTPGGEPGDVVPFDKSFEKLVPALLNGEKIDPIITNDTYGYLLTVYEPTYNSKGEVVCYTCVDVQMHSIAKYWSIFIIKFIYMLGVIAIWEVLVFRWVIYHNLLKPLNTLTFVTSQFAYNTEKARMNNIDSLKKLNIHTGDEIENLYLAITKTSEESVRTVNDLQNRNLTIQKMQKGLIMTLAELVESRDKSTGDHIKKTSAYVAIIVDEMTKLGYYKDEMTDEFKENVIDAAPLHDIGKINVPDSILCKPGKLTDEEFTIMKTHAAVGGSIIKKVMKIMPQSSYLKEAQRLAEFHHEKWNGGGYPHGIAGEFIPLSARIMAVADVFDALVSKRSYKEPFSFDKAMKIIKEESGTHFDPLVVQAFLNAKERVKKVEEILEEKY